MINVKIDMAKNTVEVVNPITGKIEKANMARTLLETKPLNEENALRLLDSIEQASLLQKRITFLENKVSTLSVKDWEAYKGL